MVELPLHRADYQIHRWARLSVHESTNPYVRRNYSAVPRPRPTPDYLSSKKLQAKKYIRPLKRRPSLRSSRCLGPIPLLRLSIKDA